jgi:hypothetical protein
MTHMSAKFGFYDDAHLTDAARVLEPGAKYQNWDQALAQHCMPPQYRW